MAVQRTQAWGNCHIIVVEYSVTSSPIDLPFDILDANFFSSFLVVVEPLALEQINAGELAIRLDTLRKPLALVRQSESGP